ncbi:MAG TPA: hypothetical protein VGO52_24050 [Hyphomonadaceae bacterium]|jgi:hypothetical protein|nr:hypothetical protein [Hyphomonadaceae bacterium]
MPEDKVAFTFHNQQDDDIEVVVEPWALSESVPPGRLMVFEVNATPPAEIEFSVTRDRRQYVYVMSEHVVISVDGEIRHDFRTRTRPPAAVFRVLNGLLWGRPDQKI